jgi:hypothetical protein
MDIEKEIAKKMEELELLKLKLKEKNETDSIILLTDYTIEEKLSYFDKTYEIATSMLNSLKEHDCDEDDNHYSYEQIMDILNTKDRKKLWKYINSFNR